jgi:hypothetical protein
MTPVFEMEPSSTRLLQSVGDRRLTEALRSTRAESCGSAHG